MSQYMLLLYTTEEEELADRGAETPMWLELNRSLEEAGLLAATGRLHPTTTATTVSAISGETELTDGPFAITKPGSTDRVGGDVNRGRGDRLAVWGGVGTL